MNLRYYLRQLYRALFPKLYGRHDLKLLLTASISSVEMRTRQLAAATDFFTGLLRPIPIRAPFGESVLVLAPHQDDETIGCGGALALQVRSGKRAFVLLLQDGADGCENVGMSRTQLSALRNAESERAAALLGLEPPRFLGHPDLNAAAPAITAELVRLMTERKVDAVFVPFPLDNHPDHRTTAHLLADALRSVAWPVRVFCYEVWGYCIPNVVVVIDEVAQLKSDMLARFTFANQAVDYQHTTLGLNAFHSRLLGAGECRYAERFFELPREEYIDFIARLRAA